MKAKDVLPGDVLSNTIHGQEIVREISFTAKAIQLKLERTGAGAERYGKNPGGAWSREIPLDDELDIFRPGSSI